MLKFAPLMYWDMQKNGLYNNIYKTQATANPNFNSRVIWGKKIIVYHYKGNLYSSEMDKESYR